MSCGGEALHHLQVRGGETISREVRPILQAQRVQGNLGIQDFGDLHLDIPKLYVRVLCFPKKHPDFGIANLSPLGI